MIKQLYIEGSNNGMIPQIGTVAYQREPLADDTDNQGKENMDVEDPDGLLPVLSRLDFSSFSEAC